MEPNYADKAAQVNAGGGAAHASDEVVLAASVRYRQRLGGAAEVVDDLRDLGILSVQMGSTVQYPLNLASTDADVPSAGVQTP